MKQTIYDLWSSWKKKLKEFPAYLHSTKLSIKEMAPSASRKSYKIHFIRLALYDTVFLPNIQEAKYQAYKS